MRKQKLLEQDFSLGTFLNTIQIGILFIDEDCTIQSPNKACSIIFKRSLDEIDSLNFTDLLSPDYQDTFLKLLQNAIHSKKNIDTDVFEAQMIRNESESFPVELNINSTLTASDQLFIVVINDISKRKKLEAEVVSQMAQSEEMKEELLKAQELSELKSRFVSMASHEFRTPLAGVLSSLNLIQRYVEAEEAQGVQLIHKKKMESHFSKIRESVGNLTQILNEFLSLGKLEEGKVECHWEPVNIRAIFDCLAGDFARISKKGQQIKTQIQITKDSFLLDSSMVRNILNNLISNAIKYSHEGSNIFVRLEEKEGNLCFSVRDEGVGIPEDEQSKLFGRFFRAKNATNIQGTGLGLNIVKKYVEMMDGKISFRSKINQGTIFNVEIPIKDEI